ncbi:MAG: hypothetical protein C4346_15310, partial [Chloroflexota bacterium]
MRCSGRAFGISTKGVLCLRLRTKPAVAQNKVVVLPVGSVEQ